MHYSKSTWFALIINSSFGAHNMLWLYDFLYFKKNSDFMHFLDFQMSKAELIKVCFPMIQPKFQILPSSSILSINSPWHIISKLFYTLTPDYSLFPELFYNYTYINIIIQFQFSSVQFSRSVVSYSLQPHESQHTRPPCPSPTPRGYSNSFLSSQWCHPVISSSVVPFSFCPLSLPASRSFPMSHLFAWGVHRTGVSASASVPPMNTQDWSPFRWTGWISLQSKGLSRVFSNTTVQQHQFFGTQLSLQFNSHTQTWPLEKP